MDDFNDSENRNNLFQNVEEIRPDGEQPLHFYYNREERIAKASPQVQEYYRGGMRPVTGFKVFFLKQNRYIFIALFLFVAFIFAFNGINKTRKSTTISGIEFKIVYATRFREEIYVKVSMNRKKKNGEDLPVNVIADIFAINTDNQPADKKEIVWVYNDGEEFLETKFKDYDIMRVDIILNVDNDKKEISTAVRG